MNVKYQTIECIRGELSRSPGMAPGKGFVIVRRSLVPKLILKHSPAGIAQPVNEILQPVNAILPRGSTAQAPPDKPPAKNEVDFFGDLVFDSVDGPSGKKDFNRITFRRMYVDRTAMEDAPGQFWDEDGRRPFVKINLIDSRIFWPLGGELAGEYNILMPNGRFDAQTLKHGTTAWSYVELLVRAISALPTSPSITHLALSTVTVPAPDNIRWNLLSSPFREVKKLLKLGGLEIALHADDTVGVYDKSFTHSRLVFPLEAGIRDTNFEVDAKFSEDSRQTVTYRHELSLIRVIGQPIRQEHTSALIPVFTDNAGNVRRLNNKELKAANMTILGEPATVERLVTWIIRAHAPGWTEGEEALFQDAFKLYQIPSAIKHDFTSARHSLLPFRGIMITDPTIGGNQLVQNPPEVRAIRYREAKIKDKEQFKQLIGQFVKSLDDEKGLIEFKLKKLKKARDPQVLALTRVRQLTEEAWLRTVEPAERAVVEPREVFDQRPVGLAVPEIQNVLGWSVKDDTAIAQVLTQLRNEIQALQPEIEELENSLDRIIVVKLAATAAQGKLLKNVKFRKWFSKHITSYMGRIPVSGYTIIPDRGQVRFSRPLIMANNFGVDDLEGDKILDPAFSVATITFSYDLHRGDVEDRASFLFRAGKDGEPEFVAQNASANVAARKVIDQRLLEYRELNGKPPNAEYAENLKEMARRKVLREFSAPRSFGGWTYRLAHFWTVAVVPPISSVLWATDGDTPHTFVAANDPEAALLGYRSLRQQEEDVQRKIFVADPPPEVEEPRAFEELRDAPL